jgi:hypothetical protein
MKKFNRTIIILVTVAVFLASVNTSYGLYNPSTGRFDRMDPFTGKKEDPQSLHKYVYCQNNPVNRIDPTGELTTTEMSVSTAIQFEIGASIFVNAMLVKQYVEHKTSVYAIAQGLGARTLTKTELDRLPGGYTYFIHGGSSRNWVGATSIDAHRGEPDLDFGQGFYTFPLFNEPSSNISKSIQSAIQRAYQKHQPYGFGQPILIVVRYPNHRYNSLNKWQLSNPSQWQIEVAKFRSGTVSGITGYDEIYGWTAKSPSNPQINYRLPWQHKFEPSGVLNGMEVYGIVPLLDRIQRAGY